MNLTRRVLIPFGVGYFLCYCMRTIPATIGPELRAELALTNAELGLLTSAFFLAFTLMQLPMGVGLDRYGPRKVQTALLLLAAIGALLFAFAPNKATLFLSRFIVGLGAAGGLMASFKAVSLWYPREQLAAINGTVFAFGGLGGMAATLPVERLLTIMSWRELFVVIAAAVVSVAAFIFFTVPKRPEEAKGAVPPGPSERVYGALLRNRTFQFASISNALCNGFGLALLALWIGAWLRDVQGMALGPQSQMLLAVNLFNIAVFWLAGFFATRLAIRFGVGLEWWIGAGALLFTLSLFLGATGDTWFWFLLAFASNMTTVSYAYVSQSVPQHWAGRANALLNVSTFGTAFAIQYLFGLLLDFRLPAAGGLTAAYGQVFVILGVAGVVASAAMIARWPKSTN